MTYKVSTRSTWDGRRAERATTIRPCPQYLTKRGECLHVFSSDRRQAAKTRAAARAAPVEQTPLVADRPQGLRLV